MKSVRRVVKQTNKRPDGSDRTTRITPDWAPCESPLESTLVRHANLSFAAPPIYADPL